LYIRCDPVQRARCLYNTLSPYRHTSAMDPFPKSPSYPVPPSLPLPPEEFTAPPQYTYSGFNNLKTKPKTNPTVTCPHCSLLLCEPADMNPVPAFLGSVLQKTAPSLPRSSLVDMPAEPPPEHSPILTLYPLEASIANHGTSTIPIPSLLRHKSPAARLKHA
jgi:hypothetical protein